MPFENGLWTLPTDKDLKAFQDSLDSSKVEVQPPPQLMSALIRAAESVETRDSNIDLFRTIPKVQGHADIIIPVYGGLHVLKPCIEAIEARTHWPHSVTLVEDFSQDPELLDYLASLDKEKYQVLYNKENRGFAATVNRGVLMTAGKYVVILNSDVLVTEGWLTKILVALEADPRNAIVNPVTNNTALVNVNMYPGRSYLDMDWALNRSHVRYPEVMPTGFCLGFRRSLFNEVGPLDEAYGSYGEEALALDTAVPTPLGWTTIGALKEGDQVYAITGEPTKVSKTTKVFHDRQCYRVTLDTGESFICDEGHNWKTSRGVKRTAALNVNDQIPLPTAVERNHTVFASGHTEFPIDPYLLGVWLGDGHTHHARVTTADPEIREAFSNWSTVQYDKLTFAIGSNDGSKGSISGPGIYGSKPNPNTFEHRLKIISVLGDKNIPLMYMNGNVEQRIALLQGLMDTDGHCSKEGKCTFSSSNPALISGFCQLLGSLGLKGFVQKPVKNNTRVVFRSQGHFPIFRLERKQRRVVTPTRYHAKNYRIKSVEPVTSVPVKCIGVEDSNHCFLIGNYVPTHNTDFWFKTIKATDENGNIKGYRAVLADNCYVFHERGSSFSQLGQEAHMKHRRSGSARFNKLHPDFQEWQKGYDIVSAVQPLREQIPDGAFRRKYKGRVAWLVKSAAPCGGMNFIADAVNLLIEQGYDAKVCVISDENTQQQVVSSLRTCPVLFTSPSSFVEEFGRKVFTEGTVLAAVSELSHLALALTKRYPKIDAINHVQSWDLDLAKRLNREDLYETLEKAYRMLPNLVCSNWVAKEVKKVGGQVTSVVLPGVNLDLFHPRDRSTGDSRYTVAVLMDKQYPFKGYDRGVEFCKRLWAEAQHEGKDLRLLAIGVDSVPECNYVIGLGSLSQPGMAAKLASEVDTFVDPAYIHSYGLPALEAALCGCSVITFDNQGVDEYRKDFKNIHKVTTVDKAVNLAIDRPANNHQIDAEKVDRNVALREFVSKLFPEKESFSSRVEVITPHLRKHGGPTTNIVLANQLAKAGHDVTMSMIYTDWNPEVINMSQVPMRTGWENIAPEIEAVIINSDNPFAAKIIENTPDKKHIMYKLSHNERFKQIENDNLKLDWDHIITSTEWLRDVCLNPKKAEGWDYSAWVPSEVTNVGWYHYGHETFNCPPQNRTYGDAATGFRVGTLIHHHPLKGSVQATKAIEALKRKYQDHMHSVGFGEIRATLGPHWQYIRSAPRAEMAHVMKQLDVWLGASFSEGLGRMALEAMSSGVAVVTSATGAEFLKHGENCLLYPPGDVQAAANLIDTLVNDRDLMQTLVLKGYETAAKASDPTLFRDNVNDVLKKVLA